MSIPQLDSSGSVLRLFLVLVSAVGFVIQFLAYRDLYAHTGGGDGFHEMGVGMAIFFFSPIQLGAVVALARAYMDAGVVETAAPSMATGAYGIENVESNQVRAPRVARVAYWTLCTPAFVVALCVLGALTGFPIPRASILVGPVSVFWVPLWFAGVVAAFSASNRHGDSSFLLLAGIYPVLTLVYAWV